MLIRCFLVSAFGCVLALIPGRVFGQDSGKSSPKNSGVAQDKNIEQQLIQLRKDVAAAEMRGDSATLDNLFSEEYTHLHSDGRLENKAEYLKRFKSGSRQYQLYDLEDIQVRLYGSTAVILSRAHTKSTNDGAPRDVRNQFLEVWVQQRGKWRVVAWVTTGTPQPGSAPAR